MGAPFVNDNRILLQKNQQGFLHFGTLKIKILLYPECVNGHPLKLAYGAVPIAFKGTKWVFYKHSVNINTLHFSAAMQTRPAVINNTSNRNVTSIISTIVKYIRVANVANKYFYNIMQKKNFPKKNISRLLQRANDIAVACRRDKHELTELGLSWEIVQELAEMVPVCSDIDVQYRLQKETNALATSKLNHFIKNCVALRTRLAEDIRTAFERAEVNYVLNGTWKNRTQTELVQDLNDLAVLARIYRIDLERINFDFILAHRAASESKELSMMITTVNLNRETVTTIEQTHRYAMLISLYCKMKEICKYGRRAFAKDPVRRLPYRAII